MHTIPNQFFLSYLHIISENHPPKQRISFGKENNSMQMGVLETGTGS
jgi:hypothetical protein